MDTCECIYEQNSDDINDLNDFSDEDDDEYDDECKVYNQDLRDRIIHLRATLYDLKKQLNEEKESWKKEFQRFNMENTCPHNTLTCQDISQLHQETKAQLQRQLAITNYKRRLLEVESMCNMELMRVKQNVKFLEPLQMMISEWNMDNSSVTSFVDQTGDNLDCKSSKDELTDDLKSKDSSIQLEMISAKLYNDMNDMFNVLSAHCNEIIPNWNQDNTLHSQSFDIFSDCGISTSELL